MRMTTMHRKTRHLAFTDIIIHDTPDYTVVNKPPFVSSLDDRNDTTNLLALARRESEDYQICHRLDKETSGIVVFAKNGDAYRSFAMQLQERAVKKVYHAVVSGLHQFEDFEADEPLYTTSNKSRVDFRAGKPSLTLVKTLEHFKKHTLLKCFPVTGRMHQIRAHLTYQEAPILSDQLYGGSPSFLSELKKNYNHKQWEEERPLIDRVALHSCQIAFKGLAGDIIEAEAPYPKDFSVLIKLLRKFK